MINFKNTQNLIMGGCHEMYNILFLQVHFLKKKYSLCIYVIFLCPTQLNQIRAKHGSTLTIIKQATKKTLLLNEKYAK